MKILHLANHCNRGHGNAHVAVDLACVQAENGHDVVYASAGGTFVDLMTSYGVDHVVLQQNRKDPLSALAAAVNLARLCARFRPDVLHAHMAPGALLGYLVSRLTRVPLINTVHNSFDASSAVMRLGDRVVAVSKAEEEQLLRRGFKPELVDIVVNGPNGAPREIAQDQDVVPTICRPAVVTVCGLHKRKGVEYLIGAFAKAAEECPDWQLYIAGWGPDYDALSALKDECKAKDRIHLLGFVSSPKKLLPQCDIFVLASLAEPGALVMSEARAAGCAIIGTRVGGIPEQLEYGRAGTLVEPANTEQLASALLTLMADPKKLAAAKQSALENSEHFNIKRVVADYDAVYARASRTRQRWSAQAAKPT